MSQPYIGEIRIFCGNFAPAEWAFCNGQSIPISENEALFNLIGTTYGGDGINTFQLPNLQSRTINHMGTLAGGNTYVIGQASGSETVTLTTDQAAHYHTVKCNSNQGTTDDPTGNYWAASSTLKPYAQPGTPVYMNNTCISESGGNQPHENMPPFLTISYIISLYGIYPSQG